MDGIEPTRTECEDDMDNAHRLEVGQICDMGQAMTRCQQLKEGAFYPAKDVALILGLLIDELKDAKSGEKIKYEYNREEYLECIVEIRNNALDYETKGQERVQETRRKEDWWKH